MARTTAPNTIVLVDDEIHNISWLVDFLESRDYTIITTKNLNEAVETLEKEIYRAIIIDLSIPILAPFDKLVADRGGAYVKFPGLFVAEKARNRGYRGRQVIIYSVHKDAGVADEARKLDCTYILKGRPREIKDEIEAVLKFDPTTDQT